MKKALILILLLTGFVTYGQQFTFKGKITDKETQEPLQGANILLKGTFEGKVSDEKGEFEFTIKNKASQVILVSFLGYATIEVDIKKDSPQPLNIQLEKTFILGQEVVITASRTNEKLFEAPSTIIKLNEQALMSLPAADFYSALGTQKGIDMISNNFGFSTFNTRGFNSTQPYRVCQYIDGVDNQSVGLNFSPGNMFGVTSVDLDNIELISGPASALYGPNALQGVLNMQTKNPFENEGISGEIKGGLRNYTDIQVRYAKVFGAKKKLAIKLVGSFLEADDWEANDQKLNRYRVMSSPPQNLNGIVNSDTNYNQFKTYATTNTLAKLPNQSFFTLPGYMEQNLSPQKTKGTKFNGGIYYRFTKNSELSYSYKYTQSSGVFQGNNRAYMEDFIHQQHRVEFKNKNLSLLGYYSVDDANKSYDLGLTGINLGLSSLGNVDKAYLKAYVHTIDSLTNGYVNPMDSAILRAAIDNANKAAATGWLTPGTKEFTDAFNRITASQDRPSGSRYPSLSSLYNFDGTYKFDMSFVDLLVGANFRYFIPKTLGKIFIDTIISVDPVTREVKRRDISFYEYGAFLQIGKEIFNKKLKLLGSVRADKSEHYEMQLSPRISVMYAFNKNNNIRVAWQSAFRSPTLNDQYYRLNTGSMIVVGNREGYNNLYTLSSVTAFQQSGNTKDSLLKTIVINPVKPEHVKTIEIGYRGMIKSKLSVDLNGFYNIYDNFIGSVRAVEPKSGVAGEASGVTAIKTRNYNTYSISANSATEVQTYGGGIDMTYYFSKKILANFNYTYNKLYKKDKTDALIPGFNTPENKINIGLSGKKVYKGLGYAVNFQWVDKYYWESAFATGNVPSYNTLDIQLMYELPEYNSIIRLGATNLLGNKYYMAYGASQIGTFGFVSFSYNLKNL